MALLFELNISITLDGHESVVDKPRPVVDVRDVGKAILLAYKNSEVNGRYICTSYVVKTKVLVDMLKSKYPNYNYPKR